VKELFGEVEDPLSGGGANRRGGGGAYRGRVGGGFCEWAPRDARGRAPHISLEKPLPGLARLHIKLWRSRGAVGNAHLDLPTPAAFKRLSPHDALHDVGKAYVAYVFLRLGYSVDLIYLDNKTESSGG